MVLPFNAGSKYVKQLTNFFNNRNNSIWSKHGKWVKVSGSFISSLIKNSDYILETNKIDITELFNNEGSLNTFIKFNKPRLIISDDINIKKIYIIEDYSNIIINILKLYYEELYAPKKNETSVFTWEYVDTEPFNEDYSNSAHLLDDTTRDIIYPSPSTTYMGSVLHNLFYNKDVNYAFNPNIQHTDEFDSANEIKTGVFIITGLGDSLYLPTKYKLICRAHTEKGECGRIVFFNEGHLHNSLKCNINTPIKDGHVLKNLDNVPAWETRRLYCYNGYFKNDSEQTNLVIYSFHELKQEIVTANFIYINNKKGDNFILLVAYKYDIKEEIRLPDLLSIRQPEKDSFILDDIYNDIKKYYKKYHNINITSKNKIIFHYDLLLNLCKQFLNHKYNMLCFGQSGSGKTFTSKIIHRMFTMNHNNLSGTSLTEAGFLGGRNNSVNILGKSTYQPGTISTNDIITIDETAEALETFLDERTINKNSNLFYMLKVLEDNIKRGIMGAREIVINSALVMFGNLTSLKTNEKRYKNSVRKKYITLSNGQNFNNNWPLYRPVSYYRDVLKNNELAMAHAWVRINEYRNNNYITGLAEASQGRITVFICIEHDMKRFEPYDYTGNENNVNVHRTQFMEELSDRLKDMKEPTNKFKRLVHNYIIKDYIMNNDNNYITHELDSGKRQLLNRVVELMIDMIWINKCWNNNISNDLSDGEKRYIEYYLKYNYNVLNEDEAAMLLHPRINNISYHASDLDETLGSSQEKYRTERIQAEHINKEMVIDIEELDKPINTRPTKEQHKNNIFDEVEEFSGDALYD